VQAQVRNWVHRKGLERGLGLGHRLAMCLAEVMVGLLELAQLVAEQVQLAAEQAP
jgi:hypothetical protein